MSAVTRVKHQWIRKLVRENRQLVEAANRKGGQFTVTHPFVPPHATFEMLNETIRLVEARNAELRTYLGLPQKTRWNS